MKGMRVQSIIRELRGEKIDIIQYSEDASVFTTNALSPAKISRVAIIDEASKHMEVIVDDSQLSLAIGKKGQNVRLAAKLLGWRIDIKSEEEKRQEVETEMAALVVPGAPVSVLSDHGLTEGLVEKLSVGDISTVEQLGSMTPEQLQEIPGIGPKMIEKIQTSVVSYYGQFEVAMEQGSAPASEEIDESTTAETPPEEETEQALSDELPADGESPNLDPPMAEMAEQASMDIGGDPKSVEIAKPPEVDQNVVETGSELEQPESGTIEDSEQTA